MSVVALLCDSDDLALVPIALEAAAAFGTECVALSAAHPSQAQPLLERARSWGVRRGCNVWTDVLTTCDFLAVARVIAAAVGNLGALPSLVLAGHGRRGAVPAALADLLSCPYLGSVVQLSVEDEGLVLVRDAGRALQHYRRSGACVVGLRPSGVSAVEAPKREVTGEIVHWTLSEIGLSEVEISYRRRFRAQPCERAPFASVPLSLAELRQRLTAEGLAREGT